MLEAIGRPRQASSNAMAMAAPCPLALVYAGFWATRKSPVSGSMVTVGLYR